MDLDAEQFETSKSIEANKTPESGDVIRRGITQLLNDSYFQNTLDKEALQNYQDIANKKGHIKPDDTENLSRFYEFMKSQFDDIRQIKNRITGHVKQAIKEKVITEKDRVFYKEKMKENVVSGKQIVTKEILEKSEKEILESLESRRKERKEYDDLTESPIVQDGFLHVDKNNKIPIPDEENYLKMSVPERRKWLKQIRDVLPKAEKYMNQGLSNEYEALLLKARKEGWIGRMTIEKFMRAFKEINLNEKHYWIQEIEKGNQLKRYQDLWQSVRKTFKGTALKHMEGLRDKMGYSELLQEFGRVREKESKSIVSAYGNKLKDAYQQKIISLHTIQSFLQDIQSQPFEKQQQYLENFERQMERYRILRVKINQLKDKQSQKVLNEMYENSESGYTEIQAKYNRLAGQNGAGQIPSAKTERAEKALANITSETVQKEIVHANEVLDYTQKKTFIERVTHFFLEKQSNEQDAETYQKNIRAARLEREMAHNNEPADTPEAEGQYTEEMGSDRVDSFQSLESEEKPNQELQPKKKRSIRLTKKSKSSEMKTKTSIDRAFQQNAYIDRTGKKRRVVRVGGTKEAVQAFNSETLLNPHHDKLSLMAKDGDHIVELELDEIRAMTTYLRENLDNQDLDEVKKAA